MWDKCRSDEYLLEKLAGIEVSINVTPNSRFPPKVLYYDVHDLTV